MRVRVSTLVLALAACATASPMQQHFETASRCHYVDKNYPCAIEQYTWMLDHGAGPDTLVSRARARLEGGDRAGAIADVNQAVDRSPTMSMYYARASIVSDIESIRQIGLADARARANPPLDLEAAVGDLTKCISLAPRSPSDGELTTLIMCFKDRRDLRAALGQDSSSDDKSFKRLACQQCNSGKQCFTDSGCTLNMPAPQSSGGGGSWSGSSTASSSGDGGGAGAWYYSWSCSGQCAPDRLAISGTEGPFPTEEGCNAARNGDSRRDLVQQSGNVGSVGYCERK